MRPRWTCLYGAEFEAACAEAVRRHREIQLLLSLYVYVEG